MLLNHVPPPYSASVDEDDYVREVVEGGDDLEINKFYTKPSLQDTISELNAHRVGARGRNGLEVS